MRSRGFTLVELLVVMTIGAILVAAAVPSFSWFIASLADRRTPLTPMVAAFELARSEAIRRGTVVSVCRSLDPYAAEPAIACSNAAGLGYAAATGRRAGSCSRSAGRPLPGPTRTESTPSCSASRAAGTGTARLVVAGNLPGAAVAYDRHGTAASSAGTFSIDYRDPASATLDGGRPVRGRGGRHRTHHRQAPGRGAAHERARPLRSARPGARGARCSE